MNRFHEAQDDVGEWSESDAYRRIQTTEREQYLSPCGKNIHEDCGAGSHCCGILAEGACSSLGVESRKERIGGLHDWERFALRNKAALGWGLVSMLALAALIYITKGGQ